MNGQESIQDDPGREPVRWPLLKPARKAVRVLEEDPDLGAAIEPGQWELATRASIAPAFELGQGLLRFFPAPDPGSLGALVLEGLIVVRIQAGARAHLELLGPGEVMSPWAGASSSLSVPSVVSSTIVSDLRIALLDRGFSLRTARWPEIHAALTHRLIQRARRLSLQSAINALPRIEERLELTFWELGDRFGRVTRDGIVLRLRLTHAQLAEMVAAQRPSVTSALTRLEADGRLSRRALHEWVLHGPAPAQLSPLERQTGLHA